MGGECRVQKKFTLNQAGRQKPSADTDPTPGMQSVLWDVRWDEMLGCRGSPGG